MKIIDILNKKSMSLSFEVFPPKKETSFESVKETTEKIAESKPAFMSTDQLHDGRMRSFLRVLGSGSRNHRKHRFRQESEIRYDHL